MGSSKKSYIIISSFVILLYFIIHLFSLCLRTLSTKTLPKWLFSILFYNGSRVYYTIPLQSFVYELCKTMSTTRWLWVLFYSSLTSIPLSSPLCREMSDISGNDPFIGISVMNYNKDVMLWFLCIYFIYHSFYSK